MLLGIVLHGMMSFIEFPPGVWPALDVRHNTPVYEFALHSMHGFRMPLFFMMSGFFTALLWKRRGMGKLIAHRVKRILLPLVVAWFVVWPALILVGMIAGDNQINVWEAASKGNVEQVKQYLAAGGDIEARFHLPGVPGSGGTPLHIAAAAGRVEVIEFLLEHGADVNAVAQDTNRGAPLHWAVFSKQLRSVKILVAAGADITATDANGYTAHDLARSAASTDQTSAAIAALLESQGATVRDIEVEKTSTPLPQILGLSILLLCFAPLFAHLWFLWHLVWLIVGFVIVVGLGQLLGWKPLPSRAVTMPYCLLWLVPLTLFAQLCMVQTFGPDTSAGLIPWPPVFIYYAIFFGFGAVLYGNPDAEQRAGRHWIVLLLVGLVTLPIGVWMMETRAGTDMLTLVDFDAQTLEFPWSDLNLTRHFLASLCAVVYCWSMIFCLMGIFRKCFSAENAWVRYISDSAYWLYLAHLPLIQLIQVLVRDWNAPSVLKLGVICAITLAVLLVIYEYGVRYTFIGTMLNGKKYRQKPPVPEAA
jgi:hypothetical protein